MCHLSAARVRFLMRRHGLTIRGLTARMGVTMRRVRYARDHGVRCHACTASWVEAITGRSVWSLALHERMAAADRYRCDGHPSR